jgi:uncharacterized protein YpbB
LIGLSDNTIIPCPQWCIGLGRHNLSHHDYHVLRYLPVTSVSKGQTKIIIYYYKSKKNGLNISLESAQTNASLIIAAMSGNSSKAIMHMRKWRTTKTAGSSSLYFSPIRMPESIQGSMKRILRVSLKESQPTIILVIESSLHFEIYFVSVHTY